MAAVSGMMAGMAGLSLYQAYGNSKSAEAEGEFKKQQFETNAKLAEMQSDDAMRRGYKAVEQIRTKAHQTKGAQRAALAAQGLDINSGSAAEIQDDTDRMSEEDVATAKTNAWREAWGYKMQAVNASGAAQMASIAGRNQARNSLLTGGIQALNYGTQAYGKMQGYSMREPAAAPTATAGGSYSNYGNYA